MHCPICDSDSDAVTMTKDCPTCEQAIADCLAGYEDHPEEGEVEVELVSFDDNLPAEAEYNEEDYDYEGDAGMGNS